MTRSRVLIATVALLLTAGTAQAQVTQKKEEIKGAASEVVTEQLTGEVAYIEGNLLVVKVTAERLLRRLRREAGPGVHHRRTDQAHR